MIWRKFARSKLLKNSEHIDFFFQEPDFSPDDGMSMFLRKLVCIYKSTRPVVPVTTTRHLKAVFT